MSWIVNNVVQQTKNCERLEPKDFKNLTNVTSVEIVYKDVCKVI